MAQIVIATLGATNSAMFIGQSLRKEIPCLGIKIMDVEWFKPVIKWGHLDGYQRLEVAAKPSPDSVKAIRVRLHDGTINWLLVEDSTTVDDLADLCNGCCGSTPSLGDPDVPPTINERCPCANDNGEYVYQNAIPNNLIDDSITTPVTLKYKITGSANGSYFSPDLSGNEYASAAALLSAVQSNWSDYGTWSLVAGTGTQLDQLKLVSDDNDTIPVLCGGFTIDLVPQIWCLDYPVSAAPASSVVIGGHTITFPAVMVDKTNPEALLYALKPFLGNEPNILEVVDIGSPAVPHLQYRGYQAPSDVKDGSSVVAEFSAGAC